MKKFRPTLNRVIRDAIQCLRRHRRILLIVFGALSLLIVLFLYWPLDRARYLDASVSPEILDRNGRTLYVFLNAGQQWCLWRDLNRMSPLLVQATMAAEDQRFASHPGIDPQALLRAAWQNMRGGRVVSGASTLSMQVVKLAGHDSRSLTGKMSQMALALRLERHADKFEILRAYLNKAPYGLNLVGCEAAARRYFGKPASELTLPEAALLAGLPKSPTGFMPLDHAARARQRRNWVLARMLECQMITQGDYARAVAAPLGARANAFPAIAPHLAMRLRPQAEAERFVRTTLDESIQGMAEQKMARRVAALSPDVTDGAALVIDTRTGEVLAHVGSPDFFDDAHAGQFDATTAQRSPGSTLKPFIYALAIERGVLYPSEMLLDDTLDFGRYNPRNFDGQFHGLLTATDALRESLNVPAVIVFRRVGEEAVYTFLRGIGLETLQRPAGDYGLGLALGNCEAQLDQLTAAYMMLASLGEVRPLRWRLDDVMTSTARSAAPAPRLLSRGTCLSLYAMLDQPLPDEPDRVAIGAVSQTLPACWKTGTSTGNHDAWAFVFNSNYVVGVWLGHHAGLASPRLVGARVALPLAASIFRNLPPGNLPAWPNNTGDLRPVEVCALSGLPACRWCPHTQVAMIPRNEFLNRTCDVHWPAAILAGIFGGVSERWPGAARSWDLADIHLAATAPLPLAILDAASSATTFQMEPVLQTLQILTPAPSAEFVLTGEPGGDRLHLRSSADADTPLDWFLDDRYAGHSTSLAPLLIELTAGAHKLVCLAPNGQTSRVQYSVVLPDADIVFKN